MPPGVGNPLVGRRAYGHRIAIRHTDVAALWALERWGSVGGGAGNVLMGWRPWTMRRCGNDPWWLEVDLIACLWVREIVW